MNDNEIPPSIKSNPKALYFRRRMRAAFLYAAIGAAIGVAAVKAETAESKLFTGVLGAVVILQEIKSIKPNRDAYKLALKAPYTQMPEDKGRNYMQMYLAESARASFLVSAAAAVGAGTYVVHAFNAGQMPDAFKILEIGGVVAGSAVLLRNGLKYHAAASEAAKYNYTQKPEI